MAAPRHLWSGDWRRESAAAAEELAERGRPTDAPVEAEAEEPPARPSALERGLRVLRDANTRTVRRAALVAVSALVVAGAAYAAISSITTPGTPAAPAAQRTPVSSTGQPWLGVDTTSFPVITGAMIVDVAPGGPADAAGLQPGEVITSIDSHPVQTPADLASALAGLRAGQQVQIQYQLGPGQGTYTTQATLQSRPAGP